MGDRALDLNPDRCFWDEKEWDETPGAAAEVVVEVDH